MRTIIAKRERDRYKTARILLHVSRIASSSLDLDKVAGLVLKESMKALDADNASLFLLNEKTGRLMLARARGFSKDQADNIKVLGSWEVISDQLLRKKRSFIVNDVYRNPIFKRKILPFSKEKLPIKSFLAVPLKKDKTIIGALIVSNTKRQDRLFTEEDEELLSTLSNNIAASVFNAKLYQDLKNLLISTVKSLVRAVEAKDRYTSGHSERVMKYTIAVGKELKLNDEALENLRLSGLLHDVGKIGIKEKILLKPAGLSERERKQMNLHPAIGASFVEGIDNANNIIRGILEHHERFDGKGYPNSLKGRTISIEGRIIAVADTFDALTTNRPYQKKFTSKEAFFEIINGTSIQFDPKVVKAFAISFSKHPEIWKT